MFFKKMNPWPYSFGQTLFFSHWGSPFIQLQHSYDAATNAIELAIIPN